MLFKKYVVFVLLTSVLGTLFAYTSDKPYPSNQALYNKHEVEFISPKKIMLSYYKAIDRGEFVVFGIRLERSMLIPVHVDYIYPINDQIPRIKVYAKLKEPLRIPQQGNNIFTAVCAVMDMFGNIVETEAHIFLK